MTGPEPLGATTCRVCGNGVLINRDGHVRIHRGRDRHTCPGSRQAAPGGSVRVLKLKDGVVVKVTHPPGTMADEAVTDELVLTVAEWAELARHAAADAAEAERVAIADWAQDCGAVYPLRNEGEPARMAPFAWLIRQTPPHDRMAALPRPD